MKKALILSLALALALSLAACGGEEASNNSINDNNASVSDDSNSGNSSDGLASESNVEQSYELETASGSVLQGITPPKGWVQSHILDENKISYQNRADNEAFGPEVLLSINDTMSPEECAAEAVDTLGVDNSGETELAGMNCIFVDDGAGGISYFTEKDGLTLVIETFGDLDTSNEGFLKILDGLKIEKGE